MRKVIIESPYAGDVARNTQYAKACMLDSLRRGEAPFASHLLYTQVLDDGLAVQRKQGIDAGLEWTRVADAVIVYCDLGISAGMRYGMQAAVLAGKPIEFRVLDETGAQIEITGNMDGTAG